MLTMILYVKLWETMKQRGISQYKLIHYYGVSSGQLDRLRKNEPVSNCEIFVIRIFLHDTIKLIPFFPYCTVTSMLPEKSLPETQNLFVLLEALSFCIQHNFLQLRQSLTLPLLAS